MKNRKQDLKTIWGIAKILTSILICGLGGIGSVLMGLTILILGIVTLKIIGIALGIGLTFLGILALSVLINKFNKLS